MPLVFLSYSRQDDIFAQLVQLKLAEAHIRVWADTKTLYAGEDWREEIEKGISDSDVVLVVLSGNSTASAYVTYEWAYAFGKGKDVVPILLTHCERELHPKLAGTQLFDFTDHSSIFSSNGSMRWRSLTEKLHFIKAKKSMPGLEQDIQRMFQYLDQRNQPIGRDKLNQTIGITDEHIVEIVEGNEFLFKWGDDSKRSVALAKSTN